MWLFGLMMNADALACDVRFINGEIWVDHNWSQEPQLDLETRLCLKTMVEQLSAVQGVRSMTVSVPLTQIDKDRSVRVAQAYVDAIAEEGIDEDKISYVLTRTSAQPKVSIAYTVRISDVPVAAVSGVSGTVKYGDSNLSLISLTAGQQLPVGSVVASEKDGVANLYLADGSTIHIGGDSSIRLSQIQLNDEGARSIVIQLIAGTIETSVVSDPDGVFQIQTALGYVDVLGTRFRVTALSQPQSEKESPDTPLNQLGKLPSLPQTDVVRIEAYEGSIQFVAGEEALSLTAGQFSKKNSKAKSAELGQLPKSPDVRFPKSGGFLDAPPLMWTSCGRKSSYVVELAQDASFSAGYRRYQTRSTDLVLNEILPGGYWFWRVATVSKGVQSDWSQVYGFELP